MDLGVLLERLIDKGLEEVVAAAIVAVVFAVAAIGVAWGRYAKATAVRQLKASLEDHRSEVERLRRSVEAKTHEADGLKDIAVGSNAHLRRIREALDHGLGRDLDETPGWCERPSEIPIIAVGNLKGGVGKTTLSANLGAYFGDTEHRRGVGGRPTLFIDFDFQASLSTILSAAAGAGASHDGPQNQSRVLSLFDDALTPENRLAMAREMHREGMAGARYYDANLDIAPFEEQLFFGWMFSEDDIADPRLALGAFLRSDLVQQSFGAVVIDLPPRSTLFAYNALIAANNVIIPTRDDEGSINAARNFVSFLEIGREAFWPRLTIMGLAGVNTSHIAARSDAIDERLKRAAEDLSLYWKGAQQSIDYLGKIPWMSQIAEAAASDFAYFNAHKAVVAGSPQSLFTMIGDAAVERMRL